MKKVNLIIIGLGIGLTINYGVGYALLIPVFLYYLKKDIKNSFYLVPIISIGTLIFNFENLVAILILELFIVLSCFFILNTKRIFRYKMIFYSLILIVGNIISFLLLDIRIFNLNNVLFVVISLAIFLFLCFEDYIYLNNIIKQPTLYTEHIVVIISVLGCFKVNYLGISLGLISSAYFSMFYAKKYKNIQSLILMFVLFMISLLGFDYNESIIILIMGCLFFLDYNYLFFLINVLLILISLTTTIFNNIHLYSFMVTSIVFEVLWLVFDRKKPIVKMNNNYYILIINNSITLEYGVFSSFLDFFINTFKSKKIYSEQMTKALNCVVERHCNMCNKQSECYKENKTDIVYEIKHLIEQKEVSQNFKRNCSSIQSMMQTAEHLSKQMIKEKDASNIILLAVLNEIKIVLNKYQDEIENKKLISGKIVEKFHNKLYNSTIDIIDIKYKKMFKDDFCIEVIIRKNDISIKEDVCLLIKNSFKLNCRIECKEQNNELIFIVLPEEKIHIKYGYGSLSSSQTELCGDNHLIKSYQNGHFLAAISDGMGKGFLAFEDSRRVLEALDSLCYCSTSVETNIEILNLLYILQGYTERYSTLDAIDINRSSMVANVFKLGASNTYIFHDDLTYTKIENSSLPLGIEEEIIHTEIKLKDNDMILFSSDGIFENVVDEDKLINLIKNIKSEKPQKIAYAILEHTLSTKTKVKDDMSIIILKIEAIK